MYSMKSSGDKLHFYRRTYSVFVRKMKAARTIPQWENLQALAVVWVENAARASADAGSWAGETDTTALSPLGLLWTSSGSSTGRGGGSTAWSRGWAGSGGDWGSRGSAASSGSARRSGGGSAASSRGSAAGSRGSAGGGGRGRTAWGNISSTFGDLLGVAEGGAKFTDLDVGVGDGAVWRGGDELSWVTGGGRASTTGNTGEGWVLVNWVWGVEPQEMGGVISPDGEGENVSTL